jgi:hypothetical protein
MLIPTSIDDSASRGEKLLFQQFKKFEPNKEVFILHSLFSNYHLSSYSGELDFLILMPGEGIFAVEVKHGYVRREQGIWYYRDRNGNERTDERGPFAQVHNTMHSIRQLVLNKLSESKREAYRKILWGTGVAFTGMRDESVNFGPEAFDWQVMYKDSVRYPFDYLRNLSRGWHEESRHKGWYDPERSKPTRDQCWQIVKILRGDFEINYDEFNRMVDNRNLIREFTEEQFEVLESARFNSRCLFQGQAGTGKTVLALELARRKIKDGKKVGLFCYNKRLGESLEESFSKLSQTLNINQSYSGPFYRYLLSNTELSDYREQGSNEFYAEELPIQFLLDNEYPEEQKFDTIIVDEAQDLINEYNLEVFDEMLKGGISNGNWAFFGDLTKQAIYVNDPDSAITLLENKASFTNVPPLRINCRNTRKVARQNTIMTGVAEPAFKPESPEGDSVNIEFPAPNRQLHQVEAAVQSLDEQGIPLNNVSILAPFRYSNTILPESSYLSQKFQEGLEFSTIHAFKGLENEYIIITGFEDLQSELSQMLLYIGLSRARQKLFLIFRDNLNRDYQALIEKNATKANTV